MGWRMDRFCVECNQVRTLEYDMKGMRTILSGFLLATFIVANCEIANARDSDALGEIKIGNQIWSLRNLDVSHFRNGDTIPEAKTVGEWKNAFAKGSPAWVFYRNDPEYGKRFGMSSAENDAYGKLYNWHAVNDPRGLAPAGWHVPSFEEWDKLTIYLGGVGIAEKKMMAIIGEQATNSSGFTALPGGIRSSDGDFTSYGGYGYWWSSTEYVKWPLQQTFLAWHRKLSFFDLYNTRFDFLSSPIVTWGNGMSIRLVRD